MRVERVIVFTMLLLLPALTGCAGTARLDSAWRDWEVAIDGQMLDWQGRFQTIADERLDIGVLNDGENLFVSLVTTDREVQRQILAQGLVLWFDQAGEEAKTFGIQYPVGLMANQDLAGDPEQFRRFLQTRAEERYQILADEFERTRHAMRLRSSPASDGLPMNLAEVAGIEIDTYLSESRFAYELKIPLRSSGERPLAVGCADGAEICLGVQTPALDRRARGEGMMGPGGPGRGAGMGRGRPGGSGGMGGGMGPPGGRRGAGPGGGRPQLPDPIDTWVDVRLETASRPVAE